ncbi:MAG: hypothetical protein IEMM0008_0006 [bacterium]|nr:MAG: hypothetical protein IEMM0008_0006 [bacterium]
MNFDAFWTRIKTTVLWDHVVRAIPLSDLTVKKHLGDQVFDSRDYKILSEQLNKIPEDIKNSEQSIRIYLSQNEVLKAVLRKTEK